MKRTFLFGIFFIVALLSACGNSPETNTNSSNKGNGNGTNVNATNTTKDPNATSTATPEATTNNAPTLTPVYKAYCAAWVKKDEAALRKIYSSDTVKDFEKKMKAEGTKTLSEYLSVDQVSNELCEVRNEKITGDTATAEIRTKAYPSGITAVFVKENGEWKLTNRFPEGALK